MSHHGTLRDAIIHFSDFDHCKEFMAALRWSDGKVKCPTCGAEKVTYLAKRRVWKCYAGHKSPTFSLKTGTIFEDSPIALEKWLPAVWMLMNAKNGISSWELHRALGVTQKSAWVMLHRIRLAAQNKTFNKLARGGSARRRRSPRNRRCSCFTASGLRRRINPSTSWPARLKLTKPSSVAKRGTCTRRNMRRKSRCGDRKARRLSQRFSNVEARFALTSAGRAASLSFKRLCVRTSKLDRNSTAMR